MLKIAEDDQSICKSSALRLYLPDGLVLRLMAEVSLLLSSYLWKPVNFVERGWLRRKRT